MDFGICNLSMVALRKEPSDKAEMINQLLFGELLVVIGYYKQWAKVRLVYDNYEGWIDQKQYRPLSESAFTLLNNSPSLITLDLVQLVANLSENSFIPLVMGSSMPEMVNHTFYIENEQFSYEGLAVMPCPDSYKDIVKNAMLYLHSPYLWGGRSPFGIDCSGFTQMVYKLSGIKLLRDASQQATQGEAVSFISEANPGDLAFFDNDEEQIIHVGIILKNNRIIHASGKVRIDTIDHQGIFDNTSRKYTHKLRLIKKII